MLITFLSKILKFVIARVLRAVPEINLWGGGGGRQLFFGGTTLRIHASSSRSTLRNCYVDKPPTLRKHFNTIF